MRRTTITLGKKEWRLIRDFCTKNDLKISGFLRSSAIERIKSINQLNVKKEGGKP